MRPPATPRITEPMEQELIEKYDRWVDLLTDVAERARGEHLFAWLGNGAHDELRVGITRSCAAQRTTC